VDAAEHVTRSARVRLRRRAVRWLGTALILAGVAVLAWSVVVWRWNDPFTALYTGWQQQRLESDLSTLVAEESTRPLPRKTAAVDTAALVRGRAAQFRARAPEGGAIGRLDVPRLGLDMVLVNGTDESTLKKGPGRDLRSYMPGQGNLVYVAGHRTTYGAPFAHIDRLKPGDSVTVAMPYATIRYRVTRHEIVDAHDRSVLRPRAREVLALQACHPRFFATQRYIVWASPVRVTPHGRAPRP
jgi:sortase A